MDITIDEQRRHERSSILEEVHQAVTLIQDFAQKLNIELFTEQSPCALQLTHCLERVFLYGLKKSWIGSETSFWDYVLASAKLLQDESLLHDTQLISSISGLSRDASGRAFLRQCLRRERIVIYISQITEDQDLCNSWYNGN